LVCCNSNNMCLQHFLKLCWQWKTLCCKHNSEMLSTHCNLAYLVIQDWKTRQQQCFTTNLCFYLWQICCKHYSNVPEVAQTKKAERIFNLTNN
jgi:hypothetical protein